MNKKIKIKIKKYLYDYAVELSNEKKMSVNNIIEEIFIFYYLELKKEQEHHADLEKWFYKLDVEMLVLDNDKFY